MLLELLIQNIVIVEHARLTPGEGLTVITGETGAGKSLLLDAMNLVLGGRGSPEMVGPFADALNVCAVFAPSAQRLRTICQRLGIEDHEDTLILRRRIARSGKSQGWINDLPVSAKTLKDIGALLVEIRTQDERHAFVTPAYQYAMVDRYGGLEDLAQAYAESHHQLLNAERELQELEHGSADSQRELDFITFQVDEIDRCHPQADEWERLEERQNLLSGVQDWRATCEWTVAAISESEQAILPTIGGISKRLSAAPDEDLRQAAECCQHAFENLSEAGRICAQASDRLVLDPQELQQIEERMALLHDLVRKHGGSMKSLLERWQELQTRQQELTDIDGRRDALAATIHTLTAHRRELGNTLASKRATAARSMISKTEAELKQLGMPKATLRWQTTEEKSPSELAFKHQEFVVQTNPGLPAGPLGRIPSGGEASRLNLAMTAAMVAGSTGKKSAHDAMDMTAVVIFDEIDSGVGGRLGSMLAQKLRLLGNQRTVLAITHTPQMAAGANVHYHVHKRQSDHSTVVEVVQLSGDERRQEIADMLGGGSAALNQAQVLLGQYTE